MVEWAAVSAIATVVRTVHEIFRDIPSKDRTPPPELITLPPDPPSSAPQLQPERYQVQLGRRHKFLRENILKLNPREMADLYGFERVAYLEDCEAGLDEFPTAAMQRLVQVFFISPKYLQEGGENASFFQTFRFWGYEDEARSLCRQFLEQEFQPMFLCHPDFHQDGLTYLVFLKSERGYRRIAQSYCVKSFYSHARSEFSGLIHSMIELNLPYHTAKFCTVKQDDWKKLEVQQWYYKGIPGIAIFPGTANWDAMEIFEDCYNKINEGKSKYPNMCDLSDTCAAVNRNIILCSFSTEPENKIVQFL